MADEEASYTYEETYETVTDPVAEYVPRNEAERKSLELQKAMKERGIVYIGFIPPKMTPATLRQLLERHAGPGNIDRIFLQPESEAVTRRRQKRSGRGTVCYLHGWIEFLRSATAQRVADTLHQTPMDPSPRSRFHGDLWSLRFEEGLMWAHIREKKVAAQREKDEKLHSLMSKSAAQNEEYLQRVSKARQMAARRRRTAEKAGVAGAGPRGLDEAPETGRIARGDAVRSISQKEARKTQPVPDAIMDKLFG
jgi:ESF2/ABP1 family protein